MRLGDKLIEAGKTYTVAGWAPVSEAARDAGGEAIWDVMANYLRQIKTVPAKAPNIPTIKGAANNPGMAG
jgi:sulfur-oxidizing protein SoxB